MKKTMIFAGTVLLFAASLLFLPGCGNSMQDPPEREEVRTGSVRLSIGHDNRARTILPDTVLASAFTDFRLVFTPGVGNTTGTAFNEHLTNATGTIDDVTAGLWEVTVTGYLTGGFATTTPIASGTGSVTVTAAGPNDLNVTINPITTVGTGTFGWNITDAPAGTTATMALNGAPPGATITIPTGNWATPVASGVDHHAILTLTHEGRTARISSALQIFQNMTSTWTLPVVPAMFLRPLEDIVLGAWTGTAWDFSTDGVQAGHFGPIGILGLGTYATGDIQGRFNLLSQAVTGSDIIAEYDIPRLEQLADATLISFAPAAITNPGTPHATQAAAAATLVARALNTTVPTANVSFTFVSTHYVATITVGPYEATVTFAAGAITTVATGDIDVTITIGGFTFTDAASGFGTDTPSVSFLDLSATITVTGGTVTSARVNGGDLILTPAGTFEVTPSLVDIGENSITLYATVGGRNYSVTIPLDVTM